MIGTGTLLAVCIPFIHDLDLLLAMRFLQGIASGTMIPVLMMAALKFLPPHIRLHGLALYALTATFAPNLSIWLAGQWTDGLFDWRWVYWQILPLAAIAALLIGWGLPKDPIQTDRFPQANWPGLAFGVPALALITVALDLGVRLDWFNSPLVVVSLVAGLTLLGASLLTVWFTPPPLSPLQIIRRPTLLLELGLPKYPIHTDRFPQANWPGLAFGVPALSLITVALDQGVRLDWFNSPLVVVSLVAGLTLLGAYLLTEWYHPTPFIKLQMLSRRNLALGFTLFICLLVVLTSSMMLPMTFLGPLQSYRPLQMAPIGLIVALPQLVLGSVVALFLYRKWVDARFVFAGGLLLIALACFSGAQLTSDWNRDQFVIAQTLPAFGQPMAVVSLLFLCTSVVHPSEGPYVSGNINTLRALGSVFGGAVVGQLVTVRQRFHAEMLLDHAALVGNSVPLAPEPAQLM